MSDDPADHADHVHPGGHDDLESERDFLLRSLDDLDAERTAGNIDADTYRVLHDDYTARASAVIQSLADGVERPSPEGPRAPTVMRVLTFGGIVVFALIGAFLLAHAVGQRHPGQQITGDAQSGGTTTTASPASVVAAAKAAASAQPKSYDARISYARSLLSAGVYSAAVQEYIVAAKLDPTQAEPLAYTGWLTALFARSETNSSTKKSLLDAASTSLDRAISVDPTYPDAYVFKGLLLTQIENQQCNGAVAFEQFLATAPDDHPMRPQVLDALTQAVKAGKCPSPQSTPTTKP
jgi:cytochrome c-type biogenesis protein CcmH/NrfG